MKKHVVTGILALGLVTSSVPNVFAANSEKTPYLDEILKMQPDISSEELLSDVKSIAKNTGDTEEAVLAQIYKELNQDREQGIKEKGEVGVMGGSGGTVGVGEGTKGNFFYTGSQTAHLNHGHVGMYYLKDKIVESVPKEGVRRITIKSRKVDKGDAMVKSVTTSSTKRANAANWANSRVGLDKYSFNFATNRKTEHTGDKNCSKLIWSAYKLKANLDLDNDKGLGVYPRDVRDAKDTKLVRKI